MGRQVIEDLDVLRRDVRNQILSLRSVSAILEQITFQDLWEDSSTDEQDMVKYFALMGDKRRLRMWITNHPNIELGERSVRELRSLARTLTVAYYSRMTKIELIKSIERTT